MTKQALTEVSFGTVIVQRARRIALDANLLRTLGIAEGDSVEVVLLVDSSEIILRRASDAMARTTEAGKSA